MKAEKLWSKYLAALREYMGDEETSQEQLNKMGKALMGKFFQGCYARGQEPPFGPKRRHAIIVNTDTGPPGEHWIAIYREPGHKDLVYDSFGRGTMGFKGKATDEDAEQHKSEHWCGQACLAFALTAKLLGQKAKDV